MDNACSFPIIDFFYNNPTSLNKISIDELRDLIAFSWDKIVNKGYDTITKKKAFSIIASSISINTLPISERGALYFQLFHKKFVYTLYDDLLPLLHKSYISIYEDIEKSMPANLLKPIEKPHNKTVVITTGQFLLLAHAPTRRVLDYARTIENHLGFEVIIINDCENFNEPVPYLLDGSIKFNRLEELSQFHQINYFENNFKFYQVPTTMPNIDSTISVIKLIREINPCFVFNVGANNITSDLCRHFTLTASIPCATHLPETMSENLILGRNLRESDQPVIDTLMPWQKIIEAEYNYIMPDETSLRCYTRESLNLPENGWLISCAGNRIGEELDSNFLKMIDNILGKLKNAYYVVIGDANNTDALFSSLINKDKFILLGSMTDASQIVKITDLYVAPTRKGGGRASFEALFHGVPVVVTAYGDSWDTCGREFEVSDYNEMASKIEQYYIDNKYYKKMQKKALERAQQLEDMKSTFTNIFSELNLI